VRDRTTKAKAKAYKRSSRNHLWNMWNRNEPATWPAYYQPEYDESLS